MQIQLRLKALIAFTALVLNGQILLACSEYFAYGEYIRHTLFTEAQVYGQGALQRFQYHFNERWDLILEPTEDQNIQLWRSAFKKPFSDSVLYELIYEMDVESMLYVSPVNKALRYLRENAATDPQARAILNYLVFAKKSALLSTGANADPWHMEEARNTKRSNRKLIYTALSRAKQSKFKFLRERYAYLAIRSIYYDQQPKRHSWIASINKRFFDTKKPEGIALWAKYFENLTASKAKLSDLASIFWSAGEKSNAAFELFKKQHCNPAQISASPSILAMSLADRLDRCLPELKQITKKHFDEAQLLFVVQREISKVEDWVLTPYYTHMAPAIETHQYWQYDENYAQKLKLLRLSEDCAYARKLASWMQTVDLKKHKQFWVALQSYTAWMGGEGAQVQLASQYNSPQEKALIERIFVLQQTRLEAAKVLNSPTAQRIIQENAENLRFLFAMARELEFAGAKTEAAYFFAKIHRQEPTYNWGQNTLPNVKKIWRNWMPAYGKKISTWGFYAYWIYYLDDAYKTTQILDLLNDIAHAEGESDFELWLKKDARIKKNEVCNLLGTHYFRVGNLKAALSAFEKAPEKFWKGAPFNWCLRVNPFYTTFYQEHKQSRADSAWLTKPQMLRKALRLEEKYLKTTADNKARYAFLLGNFYFNATYNGNAWMLRRYEWSVYHEPSDHPDEAEYQNAFLAQRYYLAGSRAAKNPEMKAFLLRMAAKCSGKYDKILLKKYPEYGQELLSNCEEFFTAYRKNFKYFK
jgi:hypothetical protein